MLRIEDVDAPRCSAEAETEILKTLTHFGLEWDGPTTMQRDRTNAYRDALDTLCRDALAFPCGCTRKELANSSLAHDGARIYPGTCRKGLPVGRHARAWRFRASGVVDFDDRIQGFQREDVARETGDFVLLRADGLFSYQLAVVVDDADAGVTQVVRGADLLYSTARQIVLQRALRLPTPIYAHLPVAVDAQGEKLSKQTLAKAVGHFKPSQLWLAALRFLGQNPPEELVRVPLHEARDWAVKHWDTQAVPRTRTQASPNLFLSEPQ